MLALSRGEGQSIIIDGHIEVKIVKWSRSSVRLAIQAPREVTVDRDEIWRKMHPGELSPLEKAEIERNERFAREGPPAPGARTPHPHHGEETPGEVSVTAAAAGLFHHSAGPHAAPGAAVDETTLIGSIEANNGVRAGVKGTIVRMLAADGQQVEAGTPLAIIKRGE